MVFSDNENLNGIFVITSLRKNNLRKTEYRLSSLDYDDQWVKLKRSQQKGGLEFRPLKKVLELGS